MNIHLCRFIDYTFINIWDCYTLVYYHRYILVKETKKIQTSSRTFCAFDIELFNYIYRCLTGNLSTLFFLSLDKCVLVPLLEDHIICDCAGILQEKRVLSNYNLQSQPEKKKMRCPNI